MTDRISIKPGRIKLTSDNGGSSEYFTMEMADEPTEPGTPLQKATLLSDTTEDLIFGDHDDRTVDEAFADLGGNRIRVSDSSSQKLYTADINTDHMFFSPDKNRMIIDTFTASNSIVRADGDIGYSSGLSKDYIFYVDNVSAGSNKRKLVIKIYSNSEPYSYIRTWEIIIESSGVSGYSYASVDYGSIISNIVTVSFSDSYHSRVYASTIDLDTGGYVTTSAYQNIIYVDNTYVYALNGTNIYRQVKANTSSWPTSPSTWKTISSTYLLYVDGNMLYGITTDSKLLSYNIQNGSGTTVSITNFPSPFNLSSDTGYVSGWYDTTTKRIYIQRSGDTYNSQTQLYTINIGLYYVTITNPSWNTVFSRTITCTSEERADVDYYRPIDYMLHLDDNNIAVLARTYAKKFSGLEVITGYCVCVYNTLNNTYTLLKEPRSLNGNYSNSTSPTFSKYYAICGSQFVQNKRKIPFGKLFPTTICGLFIVKENESYSLKYIPFKRNAVYDSSNPFLSYNSQYDIKSFDDYQAACIGFNSKVLFCNVYFNSGTRPYDLIVPLDELERTYYDIKGVRPGLQ